MGNFNSTATSNNTSATLPNVFAKYAGPDFVGHTFLLYQVGQDGSLDNAHALKIKTQVAAAGSSNKITGSWMDVTNPASIKNMDGEVVETSNVPSRISISCHWLPTGSTTPKTLTGTITGTSPDFHLVGTGPSGATLKGDG